eukprot:4649659-Alexandrium_andersonii.AAC.1
MQFCSRPTGAWPVTRAPTSAGDSAKGRRWASAGTPSPRASPQWTRELRLTWARSLRSRPTRQVGPTTGRPKR